MKFFSILFLFTIIFACGNTKKNADNSSNTSTNVVVNNSYRLIVSFISKGSGLDPKAKQAFSQYLTDYEAKTKIKVAFDKFAWGKEGETDYCFKLIELSIDQQSAFVSDLKTKLSGSDRVLYEENAECRHKR